MDQNIASHPVSPDIRELPLNAEIARHAYDLWEKYGRPEGRDLENWLEAERQLLGADSKVNRHAGEAVLAKPLGDALYAAASSSPVRRNQQAASSHQPQRRR